jgi:hypothetical protein
MSAKDDGVPVFFGDLVQGFQQSEEVLVAVDVFFAVG